MRNRKLIAGTLAALCGAALVAGAPPARAGEDTPEAAVERLVPRLESEDPEVRAAAEQELFDLGDPGRAVLERMARGTDARRAATALRLLRSDRWRHAPAAPAGEAAPPRDAFDPLAGLRGLEDLDLDGLDEHIEEVRRGLRRDMESLRKLVEELHGELPEFGEIELPQLRLDRGVTASQSGTVIRDGERFQWEIAPDGRVKVTLQRDDEPATTYEADSVDALRSAEPEIARRLDEVAVTRGFTLRLPRVRIATPADPQVRPAAPPRLGIEWSPVPDVLREQLELGRAGVVVEHVVPGSLAERLGLRRNDVLLALNGRDVVHGGDVLRVLEETPEGGELVATVLRKAQRQTLRGSR